MTSPYRISARLLPKKRRARLPIVVGSSALFGTLAFAACMVFSERIPKSAERPAPPPTPLVTELPKDPVRVVWSEDWSGTTTLLGIDTVHHRVLLERWDYRPERWFLDTLDYDTGELVDRWEATPENAKLRVDHETRGSMHPISGSFDGDLARYAKLLRSMHRHHDASVAVSDHQVVYSTHDGNAIESHLLDEEKHVTRSLLKGWASQPQFSPDQKWLAFIGCGPMCGVDGYSIFVVPTAGGPMRTLDTKHVPGQTQAYGPWTMAWSNDGHVLVLNWPNHYYAEGAPDCIERFDPSAPNKPEVVHCGRTSNEPHAGKHFWTGDGDSRMILGWDEDRPPLRWTWIGLDDGTVRGEGALPSRTKGILPWAHANLGAKPMFLMTADDATAEELLFIDPRDGGVRFLGGARWGTAAAQGIDWIDDDEAIGLRVVHPTPTTAKTELVRMRPSLLPWRRKP